MTTPAQRYADKMALLSVTAKMTEIGWRVDRDRLRSHIDTAARRVEEYQARFLDVTSLPREALGPAGMGSTQRIKDYFWHELRAPQTVFKRKGRVKVAQFNKAQIIEYADARNEPYAGPAAALLALRANARCMDYATTYLKFSEADGRVHIGWNPVGTQTGRWTSATALRAVERDSVTGAVRARITYRMNGQQIPAKPMTFDWHDGKGEVALSASLRDCFIADDGCVLLVADYDQLELRLIAYIYGVKALISALDNGTDVHMLTARALFPELVNTLTRDKGNVTLEKCRTAAKTAAYAISYSLARKQKNGRYPTLYKSFLKWFPSMPEALVPKLVERFFTLYPEIREGQQARAKEVDTHGYATLPISGRKLHYAQSIRGYNQALNFLMQGTGGALADRAILSLARSLRWTRDSCILAQVHDEVVVQCHEDAVDEVAPLLEGAMSQPAQIGAVYTGIPAAAEVGRDWLNTYKRSELVT